MKRVFLAVPLAEYFLSEIRLLLDQIRQVKGIKWEPPEKVHITLHFFGPTEDSSLKPIRQAVIEITQQVVPFDLSINGIGFFPNPRRPRIIWLGIGGQTARLIALQGELEQRLQEQGFASENRSFHPHATMGRVKEGGVSVASLQQFSFPPTSLRLIDRIVLYQSHLEASGSQYEILETFYFSQIAPPRSGSA